MTISIFMGAPDYIRITTGRVLSLLIIATLLASTAIPCDPEFYFLFRDEARAKLESLQYDNSDYDTFEKAVLLHNIAFHKDKDARKAAEKLFKGLKDDDSLSNMILAYNGSLKMIKVSQSNTASKILKSLNPFGHSPRGEARNGFKMITEAVENDPDKKVLRLLRATAAVESAEYLNEMFDDAKSELTWLDSHITPDDSVMTFIVNLNWGKYYYRLWEKDKNSADIKLAAQYIKTARKYACTPVYAGWVADWETKLVLGPE